MRPCTNGLPPAGENAKRPHATPPAWMWLAVALAWILNLTPAPVENRVSASSLAVDANGPVFSYRFLDLDDPRVVRDTAGDAMLTFAGYDANDVLIWTRGFGSIDAWCTYAASDPCLAGSKTEQPGWFLSGGDEEIIWQLQAIVYLCPEYRNLLRAIESRPVVYDGRGDAWLTLSVELTSDLNQFDLRTATVLWNPATSYIFGRATNWASFPPLVGLAHELVHAYQRVAENEPTYRSPLQIAAMKDENLVRYAFYRKVPGHEDVRPRPGNLGAYLNGVYQYLFDDFEWPDWSPAYAPLLDVFQEQ
jgi:hypothetical protein